MIKIITRLLFIAITSVLFNFLYYVFYTINKFKYARLPPQFVPAIELPIFFIITFVLGFLYEKYLMKSKTIWALIFALFVAITFYSIAKVIENEYDYLYEHYYQTTDYENLIHLQEYEKEINNRFTLGKALKEEGVKVKTIEDGYTDKGLEEDDPDTYEKKIYYINDDLYIIFDWNQRKITAQVKKEEMLELLYEKYDEINENMHSKVNYKGDKIALFHEDKIIKRFVIIPTDDDTFQFIQTK